MASDLMQFDKLTGCEKAAILMLAVSEENAARLFARLELDEVKELSQTMSLLGRVGSDVVEKIIGDFAERLSQAGGVVGSFDTTDRKSVV